jgi:hypothetical protein
MGLAEESHAAKAAAKTIPRTALGIRFFNLDIIGNSLSFSRGKVDQMTSERGKGWAEQPRM